MKTTRLLAFLIILVAVFTLGIWFGHDTAPRDSAKPLATAYSSPSQPSPSTPAPIVRVIRRSDFAAGTPQANRNVEQDAQYTTVADYQARWSKVTELREEGRYAEAIPGYVWCYNNAGSSTNPAAMRDLTRGQLAKISEIDPAARTALEAIRDSVEQKLKSGKDNKYTAIELAQLNQVLGDNSRNLEVFASLPDGDPRLPALGSIVFDDLAKSGRYSEALRAKSYQEMVNEITLAPAAGKELTVSSAANNIEVLAGAGKVSEAHALAQKLLAYDSSPATIVTVQNRLAKARAPALPISGLH